MRVLARRWCQPVIATGGLPTVLTAPGQVYQMHRQYNGTISPRQVKRSKEVKCKCYRENPLIFILGDDLFLKEHEKLGSSPSRLANNPESEIDTRIRGLASLWKLVLPIMLGSATHEQHTAGIQIQWNPDSQRSLDGAKLAKRNPGSSLKPQILTSGLQPGYHCSAI